MCFSIVDRSLSKKQISLVSSQCCALEKKGGNNIYKFFKKWCQDNHNVHVKYVLLHVHCANNFTLFVNFFVVGEWLKKLWSINLDEQFVDLLICIFWFSMFWFSKPTNCNLVCNFWPYSETHSIILNVTMDNISFLQFLVSLLIIIHAYIKVTKWTNKQWTSPQLEVKKWMKIFNCPQKITCCNTYYMCFHGTHFSYFPNELEIILTKFMQVQVVKFPILISYFFVWIFNT